MPLVLTFADIKKSTTLEKRQRSPREVVLSGFSEQISIIESMILGETFKVQREIYKSGVKGKQIVEVTPRSWFWQSGGKWYAEIRYGNVAVDLSRKGLTAFEAGGDLKTVLATLQAIRKAVAAGQADQEIESAEQRAKRKTRVETALAKGRHSIGSAIGASARSDPQAER